MRRCVDNSNIAAVLASDVRARTVWQKCNGSWPSPCLDVCDHALLIGIDREHLTFFFAGDVDFAVCRVDTNSFRFLRNFHFPTRLPGAEINNGSARVVLVRNKSELPIFTYGEHLRIRADMPAIN